MKKQKKLDDLWEKYLDQKADLKADYVIELESLKANYVRTLENIKCYNDEKKALKYSFKVDLEALSQCYNDEKKEMSSQITKKELKLKILDLQDKNENLVFISKQLLDEKAELERLLVKKKG